MEWMAPQPAWQCPWDPVRPWSGGPGLPGAGQGLGDRQRPQDALVETRRGKLEHACLIPGEHSHHLLEQELIRDLPIGEPVYHPTPNQDPERKIGVPFLIQLQDVRGRGWSTGEAARTMPPACATRGVSGGRDGPATKAAESIQGFTT